MWFQQAHSGIALDIGPASVALCQLGRSRRGVGLQRWGMMEDPLRQRPESHTVEPRSIERVGRLMRQGSYRGRRASLALKPPEVSFHAAGMPDELHTVPRTQRLTMLSFEAARRLQVDPETLEVDCWSLPPGNRNGNNVMIVAAEREVLNRWQGVCENLGLELSCVDVLPCALLRSAWRIGLPGETKDRPAHEWLWGVLDIGFSGALIAIALGSQCIYVRTMAIGGDAFSSAIEAALHVDYGTAEVLKRQYQPPKTKDDESVTLSAGTAANGKSKQLDEMADLQHSVLQGRLRALAGEIERAFAYTMESYPEATPAGLYVCGGGAKLAGLPQALQQWLGIGVEVLNPCQQLPQSSRALPVPAGHYFNLAACLGLALRDVE